MVRVSTNQYFDTATSKMARTQKDLTDIQSKLSTGIDVLKPSDDPLAMATALGARAGIKTIDTYQSNLTSANNTLGQVEVTLSSSIEVLREIRTSLTSANSSLLSQADRNTIAVDLQGRLDELRSLANTKDVNGNYLFSGSNTTAEPYPFTAVANSTVTDDYQGSNRGNSIQVSSGRSLETTLDGGEIFTYVDGTGTSQNVFKVIEGAIADLRNGSPAALANVRNAAATLEGNFDQMLLGQTRVGLRLREAETLGQINLAASSELERVASEAIGLDYAKAISDLAQGQLQLQATQQSFASVTKLSLFNYLG